MRLDDTNPVKEDSKYVEAIKRDIQWLGYDWDDRLYFTSDYFPKLYQYAINLIEKGSVYVCDLTAEEVREYRGTLLKQVKIVHTVLGGRGELSFIRKDEEWRDGRWAIHFTSKNRYEFCKYEYVTQLFIEFVKCTTIEVAMNGVSIQCMTLRMVSLTRSKA